MLPIPAAKTLQTQTKETQNEQLQPNQHPQQHRHSPLHRRFFGNLPRRRTRPSTNCRFTRKLHHGRITTHFKEIRNEQLQPRQPSQHHRRNALHRRFFRHLPDRRSRPRTSNHTRPNQRARKMIGAHETPLRSPRLRANQIQLYRA
jgi:hypothetical protein